FPSEPCDDPLTISVVLYSFDHIGREMGYTYRRHWSSSSCVCIRVVFCDACLLRDRSGVAITTPPCHAYTYERSTLVERPWLTVGTLGDSETGERSRPQAHRLGERTFRRRFVAKL